ncbi:MAG TPA: hypothetical protein VEL82_04480 [Thermoplasmata archaeon]|nr:hypothetical protein [Thermoplasmata archaeon]
MAGSAPSPGTWGACRFCGVAVAPGAARCGICGAADPVPAERVPSAPASVRRRLRLTGLLRSVIVIAVVVALAYTLIAAAISGPPVVADPLTTAATYVLGPGNYTVIAGNITGGDFVIGNWSSVSPPGMNIAISVYNSSQFSYFITGQGSPGVQWNNTPTWQGRIVFSAPYTDMYYFVITNPLPAASHLSVAVYVATEYESNVGDDGFAD